MKRYCVVFILFYNIALANCNFVIYNDDYEWGPSTRAEQRSGYAIAPLCASLPSDYINGWYKLFCAESTKFIPPLKQSQVIYAPYSTKDCFNLVGTQWMIKSSESIYSKTYIINANDIDNQDNQNIFLNYRKFY